MAKSLAELKAIREKKLNEINLRHGKNGYRVVVGMATCGIAAGARPVMVKLMEEVQAKNLVDVTVAQTGCIGMCKLEPIVEVYDSNDEKVTYVHMTPEKVAKVIEEHLVKGNVVTEYTMTVVDGKVIDTTVKA
ncbi:(2Fe-2S) ferredoxin domain-containing protein [Acetobacterium paludosum]|uniref:(2Fe-2S) ferredoxin domain-containing protein n=1 Tax=Acetobacterium paludosum TaxID=52693 RepID=A0A923HZC3_9FIRM|nr:(2Fe-2S) ferredoxin domain-containing protein [Acetobacterium paludosum]MBC3887323.1 (2Fe-2S) ferredoxin domain-containing protein [Acetobacterium paludosum]